MNRKSVKHCVFILTSILFLCGCQNFGTTKTENKSSIRIGVSLYRGDDTFINNLRTELEAKAKLYEQESGIKINMEIVDAKESQNTQNEQVERFLSVGCDVLCVNMVDRFDASSIIDKAIAANVPVIFFNRQPVDEDMNRWENLYYVGVDAKQTAVLQGEIIVDAYRRDPQSIDLNGDGKVSYVLLEGESSHQDSLIRTKWSIETLKDGAVPIEKVTAGIANWERSQASAMMEQWLNTYPDEIELVISNNDDMALGAIDAIIRLGIEGINVVGIDATFPGKEAIEQGKMLGTVDADKPLYASMIFDIAVSKVMGQDMISLKELKDGKYYWCPQKTVVQLYDE